MRSRLHKSILNDWRKKSIILFHFICVCWAKGLQTNIFGKSNPLKEFRIWWFSTIFGCFQDKMVVAKAVSLLPKWKMPLNTDTLLCWWEDGDAGSCRHNSTHWWNCEKLAQNCLAGFCKCRLMELWDVCTKLFSWVLQMQADGTVRSLHKTV